MTLKELKIKLQEKPSYLKKGKNWIAEYFDVPIDTVGKTLKEMRKGGDRVEPKETRASKLSFFKEIATPKSIYSISKEVGSNTNSSTNVLVIGDIHEPFTQEGYLEHCLKVQKQFKCEKVLYIGDLLDNHAISYHEHDPDGKSPYDEYLQAIAKLKRWYKAFPEAKVCIGNHDQLGVRKIFTAGLPSFWIKSLEQILDAPKSYDFKFHHVIDDVFYTHGTGVSGDTGAMKIADRNRQSAVIGHLHTVSNIKYSASYKDIIFAMTVGCGIDYKQYAFGYGKDNPSKPIVSCGVVLQGKVPIIIPMEL